MKIRIAELNIEILNKAKYIERLSRGYFAEFDKADITVEPTKEDIDRELTATDGKFSPAYCEATAVYRKIGYALPEFDGFILHAATFRYKDRVIGLLAKSGTGKSSHMRNWQELYGDEVEVINGDKPIVRIIDGKPVAFGTPWCGKEGLSENVGAQLTDICFITRAKENKTYKLCGEDITARLLNQVVIPAGSENIIKTLDLLDKTVKACNIWEIRCTPEVSSAEVSSKAILEVKNYETEN